MNGVLVLLMLVVSGIQAAGQARDKNRAPAVGTATISGTVRADDSGAAPVRRAIVRISGSSADGGSTHAASINRVVVTDDQGRYVIPNLPGGRYYLSVDKSGWVPLRYGAQSMFEMGMAMAITDGQSTVVDMQLTRGAVIAGRVVDEHGQPQSGVRPTLLEYRTVSGERRLVRASILISILAQTNDLGEYRLYGVPPGSYVVAIQPGFQATVTGMAMRVPTDEEIAWAKQPASSGTMATPGAGAAPQPGPGVMSSPVYHPGVTDAAGATTITVAAGEQRLGVDFVTALVPTTQVRGVVLRPDGQPAAGARLTIGRARSGTSPLDTITTSATANAKGAFTFAAVSSGEFVIYARASSQPVTPASGAPGAARPVAPVLDLWGMAPITTDGRDMTGVTLTLQPGVTVSGRLSFEAIGGAQPPAPTGVRVMMVAGSAFEAGLTGSILPGASMSMGAGNADGTFSFQGISPGRYMLTGAGGAFGTSWMQKAVMAGGRNVYESGLEIRAGEDVSDLVIVFTDQTGEISGTLLDPDNRPAPEYQVFVFSTDKTAWTQLSPRMRPPVRPASDGRFRIAPLLPGEYYMVALSRFDPANLFDAAFLEQVAAAAFKITLAEGEKKIQDLRIK
jgi:hypothetical protein